MIMVIDMKNKNGFTLIELLAVIVILGIILVIATTNVIKSINDSKEKARYIAAKEIVDIASAYIETDPDGKVYEDDAHNKCVKVNDMKTGEKAYLEEDVTNPDPTAEEDEAIKDSQRVCKVSTANAQTDYSLKNRQYTFDGYIYYLD